MRIVPHIVAALLALPAAAQPRSVNLITAVAVQEAGDAVAVTIEGARAPSFATYVLPDPPRFVIDVAESAFEGVPRQVEGAGVVRMVNTRSFGEGGSAVARVTILLAREVDPPDVRVDGTRLVVRVASPPAPSAPPVAAAPAAAAPSPAVDAPRTPPVEPAQAAAPPRAAPLRLLAIGFQQGEEVSRVFVRTSGPPRFSVSDAGEAGLRIELPDTRVETRNDLNRLDTSFFPSAVAMVTPSRHGRDLVVEIRLKEKVGWAQRVEGDTLVIDVERPASLRAAPPAPDAPNPPAPPAAPGDVPAAPRGTSPVPSGS